MTTGHRLRETKLAQSTTRLRLMIIAVLAGTAPIRPATAAPDEMDEILVTATRRSESVADIPYNISAVGAADIVDSGVTSLVDLARMVPGLVTPDLGARASNTNGTLTIRGLNANGTYLGRSDPRVRA